MFELIFGIIWTAITALITFGFYGTAGDVTVNGNLVSHEEFSAMLWPKLFLGIFWVVGIFILFRGIRKIIRDTSTNIKGEECFGKVCNIYNSGTYVNNRPELKADILVYIPSIQETKILSEVIGFNMYKYRIGSCLKLKYYNDDINLEGIVDEFELPSDAKYQFEKSQLCDLNTKNTIVVDGIEYVRKDSIIWQYIHKKEEVKLC